jgi:hypothetical protein
MRFLDGQFERFFSLSFVLILGVVTPVRFFGGYEKRFLGGQVHGLFQS